MMNNPAVQHWSLLAERTLLLLADVTVKSVLLIVAAGLLALALRRASAAHRHLVWLLTLSATLCLPLLSALVPSREVHAVSRAVHVDVTPPKPVAKADRLLPAPPHTATVNGRSVPAAVTARAYPPVESHQLSVKESFKLLATVVGFLSLAVFGLWLLGVTLILCRTGLALIRLQSLRRGLLSLGQGPIVGLTAEIVGQMGLRRPVRVARASESLNLAVPLTWGFWRPVVALPAEAAAWPEERLRAALLHELAHVRRGDWLAQMLASLACALYWFNPFVWLASRAMRQECERAADDYAVTHGLRASDYASHLLEIARAAQGHRRPPRQVVAMVRQTRIEARLRAVLARGRDRQDVTRRLLGAALGATACLLLLASLFRFSSRVVGSPWASPPAPLVSAIVARSDQRVTLANGATVRLVGVTDTQAVGPSRWWAADGSPVAESLPKNTLHFPALPTGVRGRAFAVETTYAPHTQPFLVWTAPPPSQSWSYVRRDGDHRVYSVKPNQTFEFVPDEHIKFLDHDQMQESTRGPQATRLTVDSLSARASQKAVTLMYAVAAGPWTESVTCKKTPGKVYLKTPSGDVIFTLIPNPHHLPASQAARGSARFMVSDHFRTPSPEPTANALQVALRAGENLDRKVLALDRSGRVITELGGGLLTWPEGPQGDYRVIKTMQDSSIPNSLLKRIASFRLVARPFQWAEFRDVQLQPRAAAASTLPPPAPNQTRADTAAHHVALGQQLQRKGQPRDGIPEFRQAVQIDPNNADAQFWLAFALDEINHVRLGHTTTAKPAPAAVLDEAISHLQKAVTLRPAVGEWHFVLGTFLAQRRKDAQAVAQFRLALRLLPLVSTTGVGIGDTAPLGRVPQAVFDAHWSLGDALFRLGQDQAAVAEYRQALKFNATAPWVVLGLGNALNGLGDRIQARTDWQRVISRAGASSYHGRLAQKMLTLYQ